MQKDPKSFKFGLKSDQKDLSKRNSFSIKEKAQETSLGNLPSVIQREHKHLIAKTPKKGKKTAKILIDNKSSDSSDEDMSVDHMMITETDKSKTDKSDTNMSDSPSDKITEETDEDKTYQFRIQNLGAINID